MKRRFKSITLITADIEGCLSPNKGLPLALDALAQIQAHNILAQSSKGLPLTLCSGRPQPFVEAFAQMLAVIWPCICENGAFLYDPASDRLLRHPDITDEHVSNLRELKQLLATEIQPKAPYRIEPGKEICISLNPVADTEDYHDHVRELFEKISPYVNPEFFFITHSASAVDITPKGIDKAAGIRFLSESLNVPFQQMAGIGDTKGDLPFLDIVGYSAAPANAHDALKTAVDYVSPHSHAYGVADIIYNVEKLANEEG